jgi:hypothetical protein
VMRVTTAPISTKRPVAKRMSRQATNMGTPYRPPDGVSVVRHPLSVVEPEMLGIVGREGLDTRSGGGDVPPF